MKSFSFGDKPKMADELLALVLQGKKTATSSAWSPEGEKDKVGDRLAIKDSKGNAKAIIKVTEVSVSSFSEVSEEFARDEGEGDCSLQYWRKEHERYFKNEGTFREDMLVFCERFELVEVL